MNRPPDYATWPRERQDAYFAEERAKAERERRGNGAGEFAGPRPFAPIGVGGGHAPSAVRPTIKLIVGETEQAVNELEALLVASNRGLYQRGGLIVSTGFAKMPTWDGKEVVGQVIEARGDYAIAEDAEAVAKFVRFDKKGEPYPCPPPMPLIHTLKDRKLRLRLPLLTGIVNCPSITVDGHLLDIARLRSRRPACSSIRSASPSRACPTSPPGRKPKPRWRAFWRCSTPSTSTRDDDKAVALSLILTAIARRGLPFVPLHGFDAPVAGSGKSMLVDIASILATGHEAGVTAYGEPRGGREAPFLDLSCAAIRSSPSTTAKLHLKAMLLNQMLTQYQVELRILGQSKIVSAQTKATPTATGNDLIIKGDLTRRSVIGLLDPKCEQPELRAIRLRSYRRRQDRTEASLSPQRSPCCAPITSQDGPISRPAVAKLRSMVGHRARRDHLARARRSGQHAWPACATPTRRSSPFAPRSRLGATNSATTRKAPMASSKPPTRQSPHWSRAPSAPSAPTLTPRCAAPS